MFTHELYFPKNLNKKEYNYNLSHMLVHGGVHRLENKQKLFFINKRKRGIKWENKAVMKQTVGLSIVVELRTSICISRFGLLVATSIIPKMKIEQII